MLFLSIYKTVWHLKINVCIYGVLLSWIFLPSNTSTRTRYILLNSNRFYLLTWLQRKLTLSKQTQLIEPDTLMTLELMQDILHFLSRLRAYNFPIVMVAGRAGGITMVIISRAFKIISPALRPRLLWNKIIIKSIIRERMNLKMLTN